jgi:hypothetical protein
LMTIQVDLSDARNTDQDPSGQIDYRHPCFDSCS